MKTAPGFDKSPGAVCAIELSGADQITRRLDRQASHRRDHRAMMSAASLGDQSLARQDAAWRRNAGGRRIGIRAKPIRTTIRIFGAAHGTHFARRGKPASVTGLCRSALDRPRMMR